MSCTRIEMNSKYSTLTICRSTLAFAVMLSACLANTITLAQDPEETVLKFGPDPEVVTRDSIELALQSWKWQSQVIEAQARKIQEIGERGVLELRELNEELLELQRNLAGIGLSFPVEAGTVQQIEAEIYALESDLVGLQAKSTMLQEQSVLDRRQQELALRSKQGEMSVMLRQLQIQRQELERIQQLAEAGAVSSTELARVQAAVADAEAQVEKIKGEVLIAEDMVQQSQLQVETRATVEETRLMQERLTTLQEKLERIRSMGAIHKYQALMFKIEMAREMMELAQRRHLELELENTRNLALIQLATQALKESDEAGDSDDD